MHSCRPLRGNGKKCNPIKKSLRWVHNFWHPLWSPWLLTPYRVTQIEALYILYLLIFWWKEVGSREQLHAHLAKPHDSLCDLPSGELSGFGFKMVGWFFCYLFFIFKSPALNLIEKPFGCWHVYGISVRKIKMYARLLSEDLSFYRGQNREIEYSVREVSSLLGEMLILNVVFSSLNKKLFYNCLASFKRALASIELSLRV